MKKRALVVLTLILAIALIVTITREWVVFTLVPDMGTDPHIPVTGSEGNGALMPVAIAMLAMAVVLSIAGRVLRTIIGALLTLFGMWVSWSVWVATQMGDAQLFDFGKRLIAESTGLVTASGVGVIERIETSVWPLVTVGLGALIGLVGIAVLVFGWRWSTGGSKYETRHEAPASNPSNQGKVDRISDWDSLSDGYDPSDGEADAESSR